MFLLNKVFKLREKSVDAEEKPFLSHLDDLRVTITKLILTLLIGTLVCFIYRDALMDVIRRPIDKVWENNQVSKLPKEISPTDWEDTKKRSFAAASLDAEQRKHFYSTLSEKQKLDIQSLNIYRAAQLLDEEQRAIYLPLATEGNETLRTQVDYLLDEEHQPSADLGEANNIKLMGSFKPVETFMLSMKLAFFAAIIITFPLLLYFLMEFILPGLKDKEKKALWPALLIGFGLFLTGVCFSYFIVLERVLDFFYNFGKDMSVENDWRIGYYISFATQFTLIFGLAFELPVVVMTFVKLGLLESQMMRNTRSYAILSIVIVAALITPTPDAMTLMLLALPMYLLYEMCIWMSFWLERKERLREEQEDKERLSGILNPSTDSDDDDDDDDPDPEDPDSPSDDDPTPDSDEAERLERLLSPPEETVSRDDDDIDLEAAYEDDIPEAERERMQEEEGDDEEKK